jgi:hypothetical protein
MTPVARPRRSEAELVARIAAHLAERGYRVYVDPDRRNYFDLVARRGDEVGLVEAKTSDARTVLRQALVRRAWGDWCAVAVGGERAARRLADRTRATRAEPVGIWAVLPDRVAEIRPPRPWSGSTDPAPYRALRDRFRSILDAVDRGELPVGLVWDGVPGAVRRASAGRAFAEWRLDEIAAADDAPQDGTGPAPASTSSATRSGRNRSA